MIQGTDYCSGQTVDLTPSSTFSSDNTAIATVSSGGNVTGVDGGSTFTNGDITYSQQKTVDTCITKTAHAPKSTTVRILFRARLVSTAFSRPMSCSSGFAGWDRGIFEQIVDQFSVDFINDGVLIQETTTVSRNDLQLPTTPITGSTSTYNGGTFDDRFFFCSPVCGSGGTGETDATQVLYYNGIPVHNTNLIVLKCNAIQWNGQ